MAYIMLICSRVILRRGELEYKLVRISILINYTIRGYNDHIKQGGYSKDDVATRRPARSRVTSGHFSQQLEYDRSDERGVVPHLPDVGGC